jgi:hypothetical protein
LFLKVSPSSWFEVAAEVVEAVEEEAGRRALRERLAEVVVQEAERPIRPIKSSR